MTIAAMPSAAVQAQQPPKAQPRHQAQPQQAAPLPDSVRLNMMIRNAIIALNHANSTGNYTVLRDLGTPAFQRLNDAASMGQAFSALRAKAADFSPVFFINPVLVQQPAVNPNGTVRMIGYFPTRPQRIVFDVSFQQIDGKWGLAGLVADIQPGPEEAANTPQHAPAQAAASAAPPAKPASQSAKKAEGDKAGTAKAAEAPKKADARKTAEVKPKTEEKHANSEQPPLPLPVPQTPDTAHDSDGPVKIDLFNGN